ncbi:hypothetical protein AXF42_Ash003436 [Apostasia shenzhenica]|uniref:Uncharacterized protein n=1 Tax=Apostasia shenzhenica TaxID=1088818 RepID=A0A2I0BG42_9ASPA|nr:hypothetical protein AXF42_Ash003436 [Apostasia shenzhenica]
MPPPEGKAGDACVWFITCLFFLVILAGGAFLVLYVTLPESEETAWLPVAGMILVAIPWLFWLMTCMYRTIPWRKPDGGAAAMDSQEESPGGARRVRFGVATVIGPEDGDSSAGGVGAGCGDGGSNTTESSSLRSHESEVPLAFSMS